MHVYVERQKYRKRSQKKRISQTLFKVSWLEVWHLQSQLNHTVNLNETWTKNKLQYLLKSPPFPCRKRTTGIFQESSVSQTYSQGETPFGARSGIFCWLSTQKVVGESNFALSFLGPADIVIGNRWIFITVFLYQGS